MRNLTSGESLAHQRKVVLVGGIGVTHLVVIAVARACIPTKAKVPLQNHVYAAGDCCEIIVPPLLVTGGNAAILL